MPAPIRLADCKRILSRDWERATGRLPERIIFTNHETIRVTDATGSYVCAIGSDDDEFRFFQNNNAVPVRFPFSAAWLALGE